MIAVLDWELSTLGDPFADFSYHLMKWHMPPSDAGTGSLVGFDIAALGIPSMMAYAGAYVARTGLDPRPHLPTYLAYNFFRLAAILQGIAGRVRDGTATSEHAAAKAQQVRPLAATAWRLPRGGRGVKSFALALGAGGARGSLISRYSRRSTNSACGRWQSPGLRSARSPVRSMRPA